MWRLRKLWCQVLFAVALLAVAILLLIIGQLVFYGTVRW